MKNYSEEDIEQEMKRIYENSGSLEFPTDEEFRLLEKEAIENLEN